MRNCRTSEPRGRFAHGITVTTKKEKNDDNKTKQSESYGQKITTHSNQNQNNKDNIEHQKSKSVLLCFGWKDSKQHERQNFKKILKKFFWRFILSTRQIHRSKVNIIKISQTENLPPQIKRIRVPSPTKSENVKAEIRAY